MFLHFHDREIVLTAERNEFGELRERKKKNDEVKCTFVFFFDYKRFSIIVI